MKSTICFFNFKLLACPLGTIMVFSEMYDLSCLIVIFSSSCRVLTAAATVAVAAAVVVGETGVDTIFGWSREVEEIPVFLLGDSMDGGVENACTATTAGPIIVSSAR